MLDDAFSELRWIIPLIGTWRRGVTNCCIPICLKFFANVEIATDYIRIFNYPLPAGLVSMPKLVVKSRF
jgi:hypothetical protein